jgi:serine/threonine-protein kinase
VDAVLAKGLAKDPADRWQTSGEFLDELEEALEPPRDPTPVPADPPTAKTRLVSGAPPRRTAPPTTNGAASPAPARRRRSGVALAALAGLLLLGVLAAVLLAGGGDNGGSGDGQSASDRQQTQERTATPEPTAEKESTPEETATPEPTAESTPDEESTPEQGSGEPNISRARQLQLQGFNARQSGDYAQALTLSEQALEACGSAQQLDPCGYALFEKGVALNRTGRSDEAVAVLEQRLDQYGDNGAGEVQKELDDARKKAG